MVFNTTSSWKHARNKPNDSWHARSLEELAYKLYLDALTYKLTSSDKQTTGTEPRATHSLHGSSSRDCVWQFRPLHSASGQLVLRLSPPASFCVCHGKLQLQGLGVVRHLPIQNVCNRQMYWWFNSQELGSSEFMGKKDVSSSGCTEVTAFTVKLTVVSSVSAARRTAARDRRRRSRRQAARSTDIIWVEQTSHRKSWRQRGEEKRLMISTALRLDGYEILKDQSRFWISIFNVQSSEYLVTCTPLGKQNKYITYLQKSAQIVPDMQPVAEQYLPLPSGFLARIWNTTGVNRSFQTLKPRLIDWKLCYNCKIYTYIISDTRTKTCPIVIFQKLDF